MDGTATASSLTIIYYGHKKKIALGWRFEAFSGVGWRRNIYYLPIQTSGFLDRPFTVDSIYLTISPCLDLERRKLPFAPYEPQDFLQIIIRNSLKLGEKEKKKTWL
jgi:hypothetical protein